MEFSLKSYFAISVILSLCVVFAIQAESAALLPKRSLYKREVTSEPDTVCRSNGVCGWEVYDSYTRNREYYVSSSCKCTAAELCIRMEDDISISAYVYRCRSPRNKNKNKTTTRPASNASNTSNTTS